MGILDIGFQIRNVFTQPAKSEQDKTQIEPGRNNEVKKEKPLPSYKADSLMARTNYNNSMFINEMKKSNEDGLSDFEAKLVECTDVIQSFGREGIPLKYPRKEFIKNISTIIGAQPEDEQEKLWAKMKITPISDWDDNVRGYDGLVSLGNLDTNNPVEEKLFNEGRKFLYENKANTGDKQTDELINGIISGMSDFVNIIGKQQHRSHDYSVDIHSLSVLSNILADENYQKLSEEDKFVMKMTALLHDTGKAEFRPDPDHPYKSYELSKGVVGKYNLDKPLQERVLINIEDHQWLQAYNMSGKDEEVIEALVGDFNSRTDYEMAKIFARADLKATSEGINSAYRYLLHDNEQQPLKEAVEKKFGKE